MELPKIKRNVLLNPGPATTSDTVKFAQVVPDICPRENEFVALMQSVSRDVVRIAHGDTAEYASVLYCGSGTVCIDACISSLVPEGKKILVINNGAYSKRAVDICKSYHVDYINLQMPITEPADMNMIEKALKADPDIAVVYACHHETGTGILNPIREIGAMVHRFNAVFVVDTISSYGMIPIDLEKDHLDFIMASAQKGLMAMTGLSFVIGKKEIIERSKDYPVRSYYSNIFMQYDYARDKGEMRFTPPVQTVYALKQAILEYWEEGEEEKWARHQRVWKAIYNGLDELGFTFTIKKDYQSKLVVAVNYPDDLEWDFTRVHDHCYESGYTIYPGKISGSDTFRLCSLGKIDVDDIEGFFKVFKEAIDR